MCLASAFRTGIVVTFFSTVQLAVVAAFAEPKMSLDELYKQPGIASKLGARLFVDHATKINTTRIEMVWKQPRKGKGKYSTSLFYLFRTVKEVQIGDNKGRLYFGAAVDGLLRDRPARLGFVDYYGMHDKKAQQEFLDDIQKLSGTK